MTSKENNCLVSLREQSRKEGLNVTDVIRLGFLERKKEIEESDWIVDKHGNMLHKENGYYITSDRLAENWLEHMSGKRWVKMNTFVRAYIRACYIAGIKTVQITY